MQPYIREIEISQPAYLGGSTWKLSALNLITVIFGKNGSGKSILLRAWRDRDLSFCHYVVPERTGDIEYNPAYIASQSNPQGRKDASAANFTADYRRNVVARIMSYFAARGNVRAGELPGNPADLEALLSQLIPDFLIELRADNPPYRIVRAAGELPVKQIEQLSSGEAQLITIGLDILTAAALADFGKQERRLMLIDEPDAHIHPDLQVRLADFIVQVAAKFKTQFVIATHSTSLLAALGQFGGAETSIIYLDRTKERFKAEQFTASMKELTACLGGHAMMGPLFGVPLVLVEGDDDYRIWSQVPRHDKVSFAVIPSHGEEIKKYQKGLEKIFGALRDEPSSSGYALLDADKPKPEDNPGTPQRHVRFIQLACHESENLFLTNEVLAEVGLSWEEARQKITDGAPAMGEKEAQLRQTVDEDRRTADIKDVIEQLSFILDPKKVHWTRRVAKVIGQSRPAGQIAEFLGNEVVEALWGPLAPAPDLVAD